MIKYFNLFLLLPILCIACNNESASSKKTGDSSLPADATQTLVDTSALPARYDTKSSTKFSKVIGWSDGSMPAAPEGFTVSKFADGLDNPRWVYIAPNGDVFISEANTELKGVKKVMADISGKSKSQDFSKG